MSGNQKVGIMKLRNIALAVVLGFALTLASASPLHAQRFEKSGVKDVYLGFGLGTGSTSHGFVNGDDHKGRASGLFATVRLGFIIKRNVLLGIESNGVLFEIDETDWEFGTSALVLTYYLNTSIFVKGGPAVARMSYDFKTAAESFEYYEVSDYAMGMQFAIGADIRLSSHYSILPTFHYVYADFDQFSVNSIGLTFEFARFW